MGKIQVPPDSTGKIIDTTTVAGQERQNTCLADPILQANIATVSQFHNADNQSPGSTAYGLLTGGVAQLLNAAGNIDRQRETGVDGAPAQGIVTGAAQFGMAFSTTSTGNLAAGTQTYTPAAMSGTIMGVKWSIQVGSVLVVDSGTNQETVVVTAVTSTTFTAVFGKAHNGSVTPWAIAGFVYNQERDAAGELDGATGSGTAIAAEYEYNGGGAGTSSAPAGTNNYDRARNLQGKGRSTGTVSSGGGAGSTSVTLTAAPSGLMPGSPVYFDLGGGSAEVQYTTAAYSPGTNPILLQNPLVNSHAAGAVAWDTYAPAGPGTAGFLPSGVGIEEEALWDPATNLFYLERAATQDSVPSANVVLETPGLYNGGAAATSIDRGRSASAANLAAQSGIGVELTAPPGMWAINSMPAANTQATASKAAVASTRHVATSITATFAAGATAGAAVAINLRDGATGAGTILWTGYLAAPANDVRVLVISGLNIPGSANTAITLEFAAAGGATTLESVTLTGYDAV